MKYLVHIIVVDQEEEMLIDKKVVAKDQRDAEFKVDLASVLKSKGITPGDVTIISANYGPIKTKKPALKE